MKHIFIYGPPGSGKTTVGKALAAKLERPFLDLDAEIEMIARKTIPEIMDRQGEEAFRELESSTLQQVITRRGCVIALGGGELLRDANRISAEFAGEVVLLNADLPIMLERLRADNVKRPLLAGDLEEKINLLLDRRKAHYNSFDLRIANNSSSPNEAIWEI